MSKRPACPVRELTSGPRKIVKFVQPVMFPNSMEIRMGAEAAVETMLQRRPSGSHVRIVPIGNVFIRAIAAKQEWIFTVAEMTPEACTFSLKMVPKFFSTIWSLRANVIVTFGDKNDRKIERTFRDMSFRHDNLGVEFKVENKDFENIFDEDLAEFGGVEGPESPMTVNLHIQVVHSVGLRAFRTIVYDFGKPCESSDCLLVLADDKKVFVNLGYLCQLSDYFACLHRRKSELRIDTYSNLPFERMPDVVHEEFLTLLHVVYPCKLINENSVHVLLYLADRFLFEGILSDLEKYLVDPMSNRIDILLKLEWSFQYQMAMLQGFVLSHLNTHESIRQIKQSPHYNNLTPEAMKCLSDRITNLPPPSPTLPSDLPSPAPVVHQVLPPVVVYPNDMACISRTGLNW